MANEGWLPDLLAGVVQSLRPRIPGSYHVEDYGAVYGTGSDSAAGFQAAIDAAEAAGGGDVTMGTLYKITSTVTIKPFVRLVCPEGIANVNAVLVGSNTPAFQFQAGTCRGGIDGMRLMGTFGAQMGHGIRFSGSTFNHIRRVIVEDFRVGIDISDGVTDYSGYNHVDEFEVNRCWVGVRAKKFANANSLTRGRIFYCFDGAGGGVALDIDKAVVFNTSQVAIEAFDLGVRVASSSTEPVICDLSGVYAESGAGAGRKMWDLSGVDWTHGETRVKYSGSHDGGSASAEASIPPEAALDWSSTSQLYFGARHHPAAAAHDNLVENGDFAIGTASALPGWGIQGTPTLTVTTTAGEFETQGRAVKVTQAGGAGDTFLTTFRVPERVGYVSASIRYYVPASGGTTNAQITLTGNGPAANIVLTGAVTGVWRWANIELKRNPALDAGSVTLNIQPDLNATGKSIIIDRVIVTGGRVAPADRMYGQRVWLLDAPQTVFTSTHATANQAVVMDTGTFTGLAKRPDGAVGAILAVHGLFVEVAPQVAGDLQVKSCYVYLNPNGQPSGAVQQMKLQCPVAGEESSGMFTVRLSASGTVTFGTINNTGISRSNTIKVCLHGWVMAH